MLADRRGDLRRLAMRTGVILAHKTLKLGKLADHFGDQIGLGELGRPRRFLGISADLRRQPAGEINQPLYPLRLRTELGMKDDII